ncbi:MAG TPA: serine/threonine-protein kinase [Gaiellaceae bacterium]|nr:serine/threonine-protein kinase [Gaiellaceae bacterium]
MIDAPPRKRRRRPAGPPMLERGAVLARGYTVVEALSRGHYLDVYDVWSSERGSRCVAKLVRPDRLCELRERSRLLREGRLLLELSHPHIVRAYELVRRPQPIVILETLTGATLERLIQDRARRLAADDIAILGVQLCSAIRYLHGRGYLHLDVKPANIVVDGFAKLIDLSIARKPGYVKRGPGTRVYMSPEQARGGVLGPAADVWGIGIVVYEAAAAYRPTKGPEEFPQLLRRLESIRCHRRLPRALADAIDACLEPEPDARPTVEELSAALEPFCGAGALAGL